MSVTWQGGDRWLVRHEASGRLFAWRWQMPPSARPKPLRLPPGPEAALR